MADGTYSCWCSPRWQSGSCVCQFGTYQRLGIPTGTRWSVASTGVHGQGTSWGGANGLRNGYSLGFGIVPIPCTTHLPSVSVMGRRGCLWGNLASPSHPNWESSSFDSDSLYQLWRGESRPKSPSGESPFAGQWWLQRLHLWTRWLGSLLSSARHGRTRYLEKWSSINGVDLHALI